MKAITFDGYGGPEILQLRDVEMPTVKPGDILIRVKAASANPRDWHLMRGLPYVMRLQFGLKPRNRGLGSDVAGYVEAVGPGVTRFKPGDEVYADVFSRGFAEYVSAPQSLVEAKPASLTFEQAAAVPLAALTALQGLRDGAGTQPGQCVLIIGASGGVGTFAVQLAKWLGAEVTGVCSTRNLDLVRDIGADHVIDYTREDLLRESSRYDVVFQLAGTHSPGSLRRLLTARGTLLVSSGDSEGRWIGPIDRVMKAMLLKPLVRQRMVAPLAKPSVEDLQLVGELIEAGRVRPVLDREFTLSEVPEAIRYLETGRARGKILIRV